MPQTGGACQILGVEEAVRAGCLCHGVAGADGPGRRPCSLEELLMEWRYLADVRAVMPPNFLIRRHPLPYLQPYLHALIPPPLLPLLPQQLLMQPPLQADLLQPLRVPTGLPPGPYDHMLDSDGVFHVQELKEDSDSCPPCRKCGLVEHVVRKGFGRAIKSRYRKDCGTRPRKYKCKACNKFFQFRAGQNYMRLETETVADMCDWHMKKQSYENIKDTLERHGIFIDTTTVGRVIKRVPGQVPSILPAWPAPNPRLSRLELGQNRARFGG